MQVSEAMCLSTLSYHEAWEMSYFGASVLHPRTTMPAMKYDIPITIRNFFSKDLPGEHLRCIVAVVGLHARQIRHNWIPCWSFLPVCMDPSQIPVAEVISAW